MDCATRLTFPSIILREDGRVRVPRETPVWMVPWEDLFMDGRSANYMESFKHAQAGP